MIVFWWGGWWGRNYHIFWFFLEVTYILSRRNNRLGGKNLVKLKKEKSGEKHFDNLTYSNSKWPLVKSIHLVTFLLSLILDEKKDISCWHQWSLFLLYALSLLCALIFSSPLYFLNEMAAQTENSTESQMAYSYNPSLW